MNDDADFAQAHQEAARWSERLGGFASVTQDTLEEFEHWRQRTINRDAYAALTRDRTIFTSAERLHELSLRVDIVGRTVNLGVSILVAVIVFLARWFFLPNLRSPFENGVGAVFGLVVAAVLYSHLNNKLRNGP